MFLYLLISVFLQIYKANAVFISALITQVLVGLFFLNQFEIINLPFMVKLFGCLIVWLLLFYIQPLMVQKT